MSKRLKIGIIGRTHESLCDGQTIKTRTLVAGLKEQYPGSNILVAESGEYKKHPFRFVGQIVSCLRHADVVFVLLSINGIHVVLPLLFFLNRIFNKPIIHDCIGGVQDKYLQKYPHLKKYYLKMVVNWVETVQLKHNLEAEGLQNVEVLPNFKNIEAVPAESIPPKESPPFRFCTFSRVNEAKGIGRAAEAILSINEVAGSTVAELHVYGPIEENYDSTLNAYIKKSHGAISYCGVAESSDSVRILKDYYALLFPTTFQGEGFPGTLIDAFSSGLPVIATDWHCNGEIIEHGKTGFLYPVNEPEQLAQWIEYAISNPQMIHGMRFHCLNAAKRYSAETAMKTICEKIEELVC